jgi:hypothetical protein
LNIGSSKKGEKDLADKNENEYDDEDGDEYDEESGEESESSKTVSESDVPINQAADAWNKVDE